MNNPDSLPETSLSSMDPSDQSRRTLYAGILSVVGIILASLQIPHLVADIVEGMGVLALFLGAILPFLLALIIVGTGYWVWRSDLRAADLRRVDMWFVVGALSITAVSGALVVYELLEGAQLSHIPYLLLDFATAGGIGGILVGWYDAQNRQRVEQLRVFQKVVEYGGHCIYLTAPDGTIEYVNPVFETQTGYKREEAIGANPRILNSGEQDAQFYEEMWETILSGDVWRAELVNKRKDGTRYWIDQTVAPVTDKQGEIEHFVAINRDITERKEYEAELQRQNERLDEFASVISHDLRNPLNVATGRIDLARSECESEHLDAVSHALERMEQIIDDVLTLARQGKTIGETESVSLRTVSEAAWEQIDSIGTDLVIQTEQTITADASRVQQLLENLFRNAIEHGGTDITIRVGKYDDGFYVEDTGEGLPDETSDQLFESGYTTAENGTGLGLTIVNRIAEAHGWDVTAMSGTDGGARFEITGITTSPNSSEVHNGGEE